MQKINTNCEGCVFASLGTDGIQTGCDLERPSKLGIEPQSTDDQTHFMLSRFCNAYRPQEWLATLSFEETMQPHVEVLNEIYPRMGFFIRLKTEEPQAIEALKLTIRSIANMNHNAAYVVVITDKVEYNEEIWNVFVENFGEISNTKYHLMQNTDSGNVHKLVDSAFNHAENGWIMCVSSGMNVPVDTLDKLHKLINKDMRQVVMVEPKDGFNNMIFPAYLFKFLNGNKTKIFQDEMIDGRLFLDKVKAADERSEGTNIIQWEEFNAS
jgi:hypothetical protein